MFTQFRPDSKDVLRTDTIDLIQDPPNIPWHVTAIAAAGPFDFTPAFDCIRFHHTFQKRSRAKPFRSPLTVGLMHQLLSSH